MNMMNRELPHKLTQGEAMTVSLPG